MDRTGSPHMGIAAGKCKETSGQHRELEAAIHVRIAILISVRYRF
jgi:hypothetical protein